MPIERLTVDRLMARTGNTPLAITSLTRIRAGRVVVLIDESASMEETPSSPFSYVGEALRAVKRTLKDVMGQLPQGVSVEYGMFSDKWVFGDSFVSSPAELQKSIDEVTARFGKAAFGHTAIYDSLHEALKRFGTAQPGDSIVLLTDAEDNKSNLSWKMVEQEFLATKVRLLPVIVYRGPDWEGNRRVLQNIVEETGGSALAVDSGSTSWMDKKNSSRNIEVIRHFWQDRVLYSDAISLQVPGSLKREAKWTLSINREGDAQLKRAGAIYPTRLIPCSAITANPQ